MKTLFVVRTNAVEGREDEFERWYDEVHLPQVLAIEGFRSAQRFRLAPTQVQPAQSHGWLVLYEIDGDDVEGTLGRLQTATHLRMSDALDMTRTEVAVFEALGEPLLSS